jgi:hypothetical protein
MSLIAYAPTTTQNCFVNVLKNGTSIYSGILTSANNNYYSNLNINFSDGDKLQLYTSQAGIINQSGARCTLIFASVGIRGEQEIQGIQGIQGVQGNNGSDGKDGTNSSDSVGLIATNAAIAVVASNVAALDVIVTGHTTNLGVINPIIATQTTTLASHTTSISNLDKKKQPI